MKVVAVLGSPRLKGNSATIAKRFCETAEKLGADVQTFALQTLDYDGCIACMGCKTTSEKCVLEDDLTLVLDGVAAADVVVLATPVYYGDVSSQAKGFIDRTFSFLKPDFATNPSPGRLAPGKTLVFVQTQGWNESHFKELFEKYQFGFKAEGFEEGHLIRGCGLGPPDAAAKREELLKLAEETAQKIIG
jgi:multimeric flavodoxin WrbA